MTMETHTIAIDDMTVEQLVQLSQGMGHQIEKLREQRLYLRKKIDERLKTEQQSAIKEQIALLQSQLDGVAPGKTVTVKAQAPAKRATKR